MQGRVSRFSWWPRFDLVSLSAQLRLWRRLRAAKHAGDRERLRPATQRSYLVLASDGSPTTGLGTLTDHLMWILHLNGKSCNLIGCCCFLKSWCTGFYQRFLLQFVGKKYTLKCIIGAHLIQLNNLILFIYLLIYKKDNDWHI